MSVSRNVMAVLTATFAKATYLLTPVKRQRFRVDAPTAAGVTLTLGKGWRTPIPAQCWNGVPSFLRGRDWVEIGASFCVLKPGTLQYYIDKYNIPRKAGNYVASVLEHAGTVEIDRRRPSKVKLTEQGNSL